MKKQNVQSFGLENVQSFGLENVQSEERFTSSDFKKSEDHPINKENKKSDTNLSDKEFEDFMIKSGAKGSFMVYRSKKKDEELGIDEL